MSTPKAVAVYCASSLGTEKAYENAARSVGQAIAQIQARLVYGGGHQGLMGIVSNSAIESGGYVTGIIPYQMVAAGGEGDKVNPRQVALDQSASDSDHLETIIVDSMHTRKVEMAKRVDGFIGLPGGFGTFEEVLEATTWTQLGIHSKPIVILNVLSFYEPLRQLIRNGIRSGFIQIANENLIIFVDGPETVEEQERFDWGGAAIQSLRDWKSSLIAPIFEWNANAAGGSLAAT